jgi:hypothetical protein
MVPRIYVKANKQLFNNCHGLAFQAECYSYLFNAAIKLYQLGIDLVHCPINIAKILCSVDSPCDPDRGGAT